MATTITRWVWSDTDNGIVLHVLFLRPIRFSSQTGNSTLSIRKLVYLNSMETVHRITQRLIPISITDKCFITTFKTITSRYSIVGFHTTQLHPSTSRLSCGLKQPFSGNLIISNRTSYRTSRAPPKAGWFGLGDKKPILPDIVKAGDPVLHEPAQDVPVNEIGSDKIQNIIDDMIKVMRKAPGVGLAAPQIGIPLKIIVLEDTKEYISYALKEEIQAQDRRPFDLLVIVNPTLVKKSDKTALFFEGCLSVDGFRALVERNLEVEVTGLDRNGQPIRVDARGWQARILQHECDHLDGTIYVDKFVPKTFRTVENLDLPLPAGCPKLGVC